MVRLLQQWLHAGVMEAGQHIESETGTAQGAAISPLLANVYLHYVLVMRKRPATTSPIWAALLLSATFVLACAKVMGVFWIPPLAGRGQRRPDGAGQLRFSAWRGVVRAVHDERAARCLR